MLRNQVRQVQDAQPRPAGPAPTISTSLPVFPLSTWQLPLRFSAASRRGAGMMSKRCHDAVVRTPKMNARWSFMAPTIGTILHSHDVLDCAADARAKGQLRREPLRPSCQSASSLQPALVANRPGRRATAAQVLSPTPLRLATSAPDAAPDCYILLCLNQFTAISPPCNISSGLVRPSYGLSRERAPSTPGWAASGHPKPSPLGTTQTTARPPRNSHPQLFPLEHRSDETQLRLVPERTQSPRPCPA